MMARKNGNGILVIHVYMELLCGILIVRSKETQVSKLVTEALVLDFS